MKGLIWNSCIIALAISATLSSSAVYACRSSDSHRSILLDDPPIRPPAGAVMLEVQVASISDEVHKNHSIGIEVSIIRNLHADVEYGSILPKTIMIKPQVQSSCTGWGVVGRPATVVGYLNWDREGRVVLVPVEYRSKEYRTQVEDGVAIADKKAKRKTLRD